MAMEAEQDVTTTTTTETTLHLEFQSQIVLPGDDVTSSVTRVTKKIKLGGGLQRVGDAVKCVNAGTLRYRPPNRYWVDSKYQRYVPCENDGVIGIVEDRKAETYTVDLQGISSGSLPILAFDGASKRNRPNLLKGTLLYARVKQIAPNMDAVLTCEATAGMTKKDWMTGESVYGELMGGHVIDCSIPLAKRLLRKDCAVLQILGNSVPFEVVIGMNGRVWINAKTDREIVIVANAILNSEFLTDAAIPSMVNHLLQFNLPSRK